MDAWTRGKAGHSIAETTCLMQTPKAGMHMRNGGGRASIVGPRHRAQRRAPSGESTGAAESGQSWVVGNPPQQREPL